MTASNKKVITRVRLQRILQGMKHRCLNPNNKNYEYYGGRGITVCDEWLDYNNFESWALSNGYGDNLTIDRIDNNKGYSPDNCQWITRGENSSKRVREGGIKRPQTYKKQELPEELIKQLNREGLGLKAIASRLKKERDIKVSHMTIQRLLLGKRKRKDTQ